MESLLPTEIARLVYGYLIEENCESAAQLFLETSLHLKECLLVVKKGRRFNTRVSDHSLVDILDKLCEVTCIVKFHLENNISEAKPENVLLQKLKALLIPVEIRRVRRNCYPNTPEITLDGKVIDVDVKQSSVADRGEVFQTALESTEKSFHTNQQEIISHGLRSAPNCNEILLSGNNLTIGTFNVSPPGLGMQQKDLSLPILHDKSQIVEKLGNKEHLPNDINLGKMGLNITQGTDIQVSRNINKFNLESESEVNNRNERQDIRSDVSLIPVTLSPSATPLAVPPVIFKQPLLSPNSQVLTNNVRMQVCASSNFNIPLNHKISKETMNIQKLQQPITTNSSLKSSLIRTPASIYIKPQIMSPFVKNIYTAAHLKKNPVLLIKSVPDNLPNESVLKESSTISLNAAVDTTNDKILDGPVIIKRSGVRTRGGKSGGKFQRRLKALIPKKTFALEENSNLNTKNIPNEVETYERSENSRSSKSDNNETNSIIVSPGTSVEQQTMIDEKIASHPTNEQKQPDVPASPKPSPKAELVTRTFRKRLSQSVPRRGSHVRALEFKTPSKGGSSRRALTSPKQLLSNRSPSNKKTLKCVRVSLFKNTPLKKESKAWDADLRKCLAESANSSSAAVSKRKNVKNSKETYKEPSSSKRKSLNEVNKKELSSDQVSRPSSTQKDFENLNNSSDKNSKDRLPVIAEEESDTSDTDLAEMLTNDRKVHSTPIKPDISIETVNKVSHFEELTPEAVKQMNNQGNPVNLISDNILDSEGKRAAAYTRPEPKAPFMAPLSKISPEPKEMSGKPTFTSKLPEQTSFMTPLSKALNEHKEFLEHTLLTPGTPLRENVQTINKDNHNETPLSKISSPCFASQDSLEASLIKECTRIEKENSFKNSVEALESNANNNMGGIFFTKEKKEAGHGSDNIKANESNEKSSIVLPISNNMLENLKTDRSVTPFRSSIFSPEKTSDDVLSKPLLHNQTFKDSSGYNENTCRKGDSSFKLTETHENFDSLESEKFNNCEEVINSEHAVSDRNQVISAKNNYSHLKVSCEEKDIISSQKHITFGRKLRSSSRIAKNKKNEPNNDFDRSKLIAQCIQSAKENLYRINKNSASSPENTEKVSRKESHKILKGKNLCKRKSKNKTRNSSFSASSTDEAPTSFDKSISLLLLSNSDSSSFPDDSSTIIQKKAEHNSPVKNGDQNVEVSQMSKFNSTAATDVNSMKETPVKHISDSSSESESERPTVVEDRNQKVETSPIHDKNNCSRGDIKSIESELPLKIDANISKNSADSVNKFSEFLNDFVYTFTLKLDGKNVTKQLKVSPFYNIFESDSEKVASVTSSTTERAERSALISVAESVKKSYKRKHECEPKSPENQRNSNAAITERPVKKYKRASDYSEECRRTGRSSIRRHNEAKRDPRIPNRRYYRDSPYTRRYRGKYEPSRSKRYYDKSRLRRSSRSVSRDADHPRIVESPRRSYRTNEASKTLESSNRKHKDRNDLKKYKDVLKSREGSPRNKFDSSRNFTNNFSISSSKDKKEKRILADKEDGEISESSHTSKPTTIGGSQRSVTKQNLPPIDEDTRAILMGLNLDQFLSMLHGSEK